VDSLRPVFRWLLIIGLIGAAVKYYGPGGGGPPTGAPAPAISAPVLGQAAPFELTAHRGRTIVLDFWATWCPPCQRTLPALQQLHDHYKGTDVDVFAVNTDSPDAGRDRLVGEFLKRRGYGFPVILDGGAISRDYRIQAIPTLVIIRPDGRVEEAHVGLLDDDPKAIFLAISEMIEAARKTPAGA
jgi:thiol-disulfide isomerase/thioredoxin